MSEIRCNKCNKLLANRPYPNKKLDGAEVLQDPYDKTIYWQKDVLEIKCHRCKELNVINI